MVLPDNAVFENPMSEVPGKDDFFVFALESNNTLLLLCQFPTSTGDSDYEYPVIQEIDSAGHLKPSGFNHGPSDRLISLAGTPAYDLNAFDLTDHFLKLAQLPDGDILAAFPARQQVGDHYRLVSVLEEFTGT